MLDLVIFKNKRHKLIITNHARERMEERGILRSTIINIIETGTPMKKSSPGKWWVYKDFDKRKDNSICLSISVEDPCLILVTTLVNWSPRT